MDRRIRRLHADSRNKALREENEKLRAEAARAKKEDDPEIAMGKTFSELAEVLTDIKIKVPPELSIGPETQSLFGIFLKFPGTFASGVCNAATASQYEKFLFSVARRLIPFGLVDRAKVPSNVYWDKLATTNAGNRFLAEAQIRRSKAKNSRKEPQANNAAPNGTAEPPSDT